MNKFCILPFAPGISWELKYSKFIIPKVKPAIISNIIEDRKINLIAYGGFLESFFSLSFFEAYHKLYPEKDLYWIGNDKFKSLLDIQGLAKESELIITKTSTKRFPAPLFLDKEDNVYFNCLNNYKTLWPINDTNTRPIPDNSPMVSQIFSKFFIDWNTSYLPVMRNLVRSKSLDYMFNLHRFNMDKPYILIFPGRTNFNKHRFKGLLKWKRPEIESLALLLKAQGIATVVFTNDQSYWSSSLPIVPIDIDSVLYLMPKAAAVLANNVDYLFVASALSKAKIISEPGKRFYKTQKNVEVINKATQVFVNKDLNIRDVADFIKG